MTSNRPTVIKEDTSEEEEILSFKENRYFSPVLSGVEGLDDNIIIMIPYRQNISFRDTLSSFVGQCVPACSGEVRGWRERGF